MEDTWRAFVSSPKGVRSQDRLTESYSLCDLVNWLSRYKVHVYLAAPVPGWLTPLNGVLLKKSTGLPQGCSQKATHIIKHKVAIRHWVPRTNQIQLIPQVHNFILTDEIYMKWFCIKLKWSEFGWNSWRQKYNAHEGDFILRVFDCIVTIWIGVCFVMWFYYMFCNGWVCVCVGFVMCECVGGWVL